MEGLVTVRIPAGAVVRLSARELLAIERAAGHDRSLDDAPAPAAPDETCGAAVEVPGVVLGTAPGWATPTPARLSAAEKEALKDWAATRGARPKYVTKQRIRDYVVATGDVTFEHLLERTAPRWGAHRPTPCTPSTSEAEGGAA